MVEGKRGKGGVTCLLWRLPPPLGQEVLQALQLATTTTTTTATTSR
jgi:hypothetical protein